MRPLECGRGGFWFGNLTPGVESTIRASATGYATKEVTVFPMAGAIPLTVITLSRSDEP